MPQFNIDASGPRGWLARIGIGLTLILTIVAGIALSAVLFAVVAVAGLIGGIWMWWKTRHLRKHIREQQADILDAEYEVIDDHPPPADTSSRPKLREKP